MSNNNNDFRFRSSLKGFHRGDVLTYLEQRAKEHTDQRNELAVKLEASRQELSDLRDNLTQTESELQNTKTKSEAQAAELEELRGVLDELHSTNAALEERDTVLEQELNELRSERDSLLAALVDLDAQKSEVESAKLHVAEIELDAYSRAKKIENNAIDNANLARRTLSDLISDAKDRFDRVKSNANSTFLRMAQEMDSLKDILMQMPESFDSISNDMETLRFGNDRKATESESETESPDVDINVSDSGVQLNMEEHSFFRGEEAEGGEDCPDPGAYDSGSTESSGTSRESYTYSFRTEDDESSSTEVRSSES